MFSQLCTNMFRPIISSKIQSSSVEWYRSYNNLRHLLNPISFSTSTSNNNNNNNNNNNSNVSIVSDTTTNTTANNAKQQTIEGALPKNSRSLTTSQFPSREDCNVLILGCGCSSFGADMIRDGWAGRIVNVDFSPIVIEQMKKKYNDEYYEELAKKRVTNSSTKGETTINKMEFICADLTDENEMEKLFVDSSFDLILCKATLDAVLNTPTPMINARKLIRQCKRMLADQHGILFVVTNGNPDNRLEYFEYDNNLHYHWQNVSIHSLNNPGGSKHNNQNHRSTNSSYSSNNERFVIPELCIQNLLSSKLTNFFFPQ
jgi:SAM-dependent methyltransferase